MMKKFLLVVCGSFVGVWLALILMCITSIIFSFAVIGMGASKSANVTDKTLLCIDLSGGIDERSGSTPVDMMAILNSDFEQTPSLNVLLDAIEKAKGNDDIKGIVIDCNGCGAGAATATTLRNALNSFKSSGKFIYAYGDNYSQTDYYIASVADSLFLNPVGSVDLHGLASVTPYFKKLLDKAGIEMQVVRVGAFKSAVEPYLVDTMSEANRLQQEHYLGSIWKSMSDSMAISRKMNATELNGIVDGVLAVAAADTLVKFRIVDKLCYRTEFEDNLKQKLDIEDDEDLNMVCPSDIADDQETVSSGNKIAVLYAVGEIDAQAGPVGGSTGINSEEIVETIQELIDDDDVKGLVLRVNSPGGSAFGSEQMWKAVEDFKKSGKPVAVSMGDYAASGGYYMSCGAQRIFAEPTTITGSIGIFGVIPCAETLIHDKLGVNYGIVKTHENADMGAMLKRLTPAQTAAMQQTVNDGYELFTRRCADGRHLSQDSIKSIAQGRVWDACSAKSIGLVDELGNLESAVKWVAGKAKLKDGDYTTMNCPSLHSDWRNMFGAYMMDMYESRLARDMGFMYEYHKQLLRIMGRERVLCLMEQSEIE